jgi:hypothetical protein
VRPGSGDGRATVEHGAELRVVECVCGEAELRRPRAEGRSRGIPGWHEIGWDHVERMRREYPPLTVDRLVVDAVESVEDDLDAVRARPVSGD